MTQIQDVRLIIKIDNKRPIELLDLTRALVSLANQFDCYVDKYADTPENREATLYVKEIKAGSVILELVELATVGMIPFLENTNTIIEFAKYCKNIISFFIKNEGDDPKLTPSELRDFSTILSPVAKDNGSQFNLSTTINGNVTMNININSLESNAFQNIVKQQIDRLKIPEQIEDIKSKVLLTWFQARNDLKSKIGNKGTIEELSKKPLNITFDNDEIKEQMLHGDVNPFNTAFVVDVKIQTIQDKPAVYKVVKLHELIDVNDEENNIQNLTNENN